jgi:predicted ABC-type ATPase
MPIRSSRSKRRATFEDPVMTAEEVMRRVRRCELEGFLVEEKYIKLKSEEEIARERYLSIEEITRKINKVIWYCASGPVPRWITTRNRPGQEYEQWRRGSKYQRIFRG